MRFFLFCQWAVAAMLLLSACQASRSPTKTVELYLQARVQGDVNTMINLSCPEWEGQAQIESSTFAAFQAQLDGMSCEDAGGDGASTLVSCKGKIVTSYNGETREFSLAERQFKVVQQSGEWRMCGYQ